MKIDNYKIIVGNATDVGKIRQYNEDYMAHFDTSYGYCIIVCDGMGGHAAGDVASQAAIEAIKHYLQDGKVTKLDTANSLLNAIEFANFKLREMVLQNPALSGMGTTCVIALINNAEMYVAHAGDSRLYLIRNNEIRQISKDHSTVQNLIDAGALTEEEALQSDKRNQITKAIGIFEKVVPGITSEPIPLKHNDKIMLCSDGLTAHVNLKSLLELINTKEDVQAIAMNLIDKANLGGGTDNITVQLIQYTGKSSSIRKSRRKRKFIRMAVGFLFFVALGFFLYLKTDIFRKTDSSKNGVNNTSVNQSSTPVNKPDSLVSHSTNQTKASHNKDKIDKAEKKTNIEVSKDSLGSTK